MEPAIQLGDRAKDKITSLEGIVTARCSYLTGCDQLLIKPQGLHDGKPLDGFWFDENRCDLVESGAIVITTTAVSESGKPLKGGPAEHPASKQ